MDMSNKVKPSISSQKKSHTDSTEVMNKNQKYASPNNETSVQIINDNNNIDNEDSVMDFSNEEKNGGFFSRLACFQFQSFRRGSTRKNSGKHGNKETTEVVSNRQCLQLNKVEDCASLNQSNESCVHLDQQLHERNEEPMTHFNETKEKVYARREEKDKEEAVELNVSDRSDGSFQLIDKRNQEIGKSEDNFRKTEKAEENEDVLKEETDKVAVATQNKQTRFNKRKDTCGISGQLYEIYLVLLILLHGLTNKNITHFHLASNLEEAGAFDDIVFSYSYKDLNGADKCKVIFLQAKHKEKIKNISIATFLGKAGKSDFDLMKYFNSFREIKKNFEVDNPKVIIHNHPIFGRNFNECEFIIFTNASFKHDPSETIYLNKFYAEEDWVLNFSEECSKYHQLCFMENECDRIEEFLANAGNSEVHEFQEFLSKLKVCLAQPNQDKLKKIIKEQIQYHYHVRKSDIDAIFADVSNKVLEWWKDSSDYLTKENTFIIDAARISIRFEVRDPVPVFTGREQPLLDLHKALQSARQYVISQTASVTGLGGIGKTELARKYVSQYSQHYDNNIIWINAESYTTCSESFRRLAGDRLEIGIQNKDGKEKDITSIISEVYDFFAKRGRNSLFIFDNAENPQDGVKEHEHVKNFLPTGDSKPHVLITSRNQQWGGINSLQLGLFTQEESAQFIKRTLSESEIELKESEINSLGEKLQYLPLALRQAVAYIAKESERLKKWNIDYTIENYLKEFDEKSIELLAKAPQEMYDSYTKTVLTTWQITIEKIRKNEKYGMKALLMLNSIAFLSPDNIPIVTMFENIMDIEIVRGCAEILEQYSMVILHNEEVSIHRLLQQVIRMMLKKEENEEEILKRTLNLFKSDISSNCIMHARSVWDYAKNFNKILLDFSYFPLGILTKLVDAIQYNEAYLFVIKTYTLFKEVLGENHHDTLSLLHWLGSVLNKQGKFEESLIHYQEVLCKRRNILGPEHLDTLNTMHNLASVLNSQGKCKESLMYYQEVLWRTKEILGPDHIHTLTTMHNLASVLEHEGKYEELLVRYQEILSKQKEILGQDHPYTLHTMHNLAVVLDILGQHERTLNLYQEVLLKRSNILGPDHPDLLTTMHNLASALENQGQFDESRMRYEEVLSKQKEILGPGHLNTLNTMHSLASALDNQGKYDESLILYQEVLSKQLEILGTDHPNTLNTKHNLAFVYNNQEKYEESLILYDEVLCKRIDIFGQDHVDTLNTMHNLALVLDNQGNYEESLMRYQEVLWKRKEILGPNHVDTLSTMHNLASVLCNIEQYEESLILYQEVLSMRKEILGLDHTDTLKTMHDLASVLYNQGKFDESLILYQEVLYKRKQMLGPNHPNTLRTMHNLAGVLYNKGKYEESLILYQEVVCKRREVLGPDHPDTINAMNNLTVASSTKKFNKLHRFVKRIFRIRPPL